MMPMYPISDITIPVSAIFAENDTLCPVAANQSLYSVIPGLYSETALGASNYDLVGSNSPSLVSILAGVEALVPDERDVCAVPYNGCFNARGETIECAQEKSGCKSIEDRMFAWFEVLVADMDECVEHSVGNPKKIKKRLDRLCNRMERRGMDFEEPMFMTNYALLAEGAQENLA